MKIYFPNLNNINEWTEWHLTYNGWEKGTQKREDNPQLIKVEPPDNRVLTCRYHENITINSTWLQKHIIEIWRDSDCERIDELLENFAGCPESL
ncbi:hypothetical protein NIES4071_08630 [Calothrix sp. NIES-4071]|nr:hypothetical protein NIES4071_08630 [Calothrix sp. NIES-4071]BAZ55205.1 hypothetical protein NIES4105_08590 [Calothrix sp. NIES-4105]